MELPLMYHWAPAERRESIIRQGLLVFTADTAQEFAWPYICLSPDPARAWNLSGAMERYTEIEEWDLYQVRLGLDDDVRLRVEGATIWEARVHNSIPADRLWWVGTREPLAAKELA
jgi:hypothetical protein